MQKLYLALCACAARADEATELWCRQPAQKFYHPRSASK